MTVYGVRIKPNICADKILRCSACCKHMCQKDGCYCMHPHAPHHPGNIAGKHLILGFPDWCPLPGE